MLLDSLSTINICAAMKFSILIASLLASATAFNVAPVAKVRICAKLRLH